MTTSALPLSADSPQLPLDLAEDELLCERRADALYNISHRLGGMGFLLITLAWLNRQFWAHWNQTIAEVKNPSLLQWITMILVGQFALPVTLFLGIMAERSMEKRRALLPKDHAHALPMDDPRLLHLSLIGIPAILTIDNIPDIVECVRSGGEMHLRVGDTTVCVWMVEAENGNDIATTHVSEPLTDIIIRKDCIEAYTGHKSVHVSLRELASILGELQDGTPEVLSSDIEYTTISTNAARTLRFELLF